MSPESSASPGKWHTPAAPYLKDIMDAILEPDIEEVVVMGCAQFGKTEAILNTIGYFAENDPSPMMLVLPTLIMAEDFSKDRLDPMIRDTPVLSRIFGPVKSRDSGNTLLRKVFPCGQITLSGANSPSSLASRPKRIVIGDEVDRFPESVGDEGDPLGVMKVRADAFHNRKFLWTSTPTIRGFSRIEKLFNESDQRRFHVPCPHCGAFQTLKWCQIKYWKDSAGHPKKIRYICEHCETGIRESRKHWMLRNGRWEKDNPSSRSAGFHLNGLYSPWLKWEKIIIEHRSAAKKRDRERMKVWTNTRLGETWEDSGETVDNKTLFARREKYRAEVPAGALLLTAGVDTHDNRFEMQVDGFGVGEERWTIDYRIIWGDPSDRDTKDALDDALSRTYTSENGFPMRISAALIDALGHRTQAVYDFCKGKQYRTIFAAIGKAGEGRPIVTSPLKKRTGKNRRPVELVIVGVDEAKLLLKSRLELKEHGPAYWHFPLLKQFNEEYFRQLASEKLTTQYNRGFQKRVWVKTRTRNEAWDCSVLSLGALYVLDPDWAPILARMERKKESLKKPAGSFTEPQIRPRRRQNWLNSWRNM
ncbi:MAG: phage terminase large subunit family protein [Candidatus Eisenbacteria bacterium]|uniref:Phage terminase large subunit family protein n=1 Tax=Eiseniibacteriota bacterium TaxID=2212470 RepID=A0A948RVN7_UNCEI|nr:phage terminase large subunit family protein [Candidatus Eisenbacteria bacterium]